MSADYIVVEFEQGPELPFKMVPVTRDHIGGKFRAVLVGDRLLGIGWDPEKDNTDDFIIIVTGGRLNDNGCLMLRGHSAHSTEIQEFFPFKFVGASGPEVPQQDVMGGSWVQEAVVVNAIPTV